MMKSLEITSIPSNHGQFTSVEDEEEEDMGTCTQMRNEGWSHVLILVTYLLSLIYLFVFYIVGAVIAANTKGFNPITDKNFIIANVIVLFYSVVSGVFLVCKKNEIERRQQNPNPRFIYMSSDIIV